MIDLSICIVSYNCYSVLETCLQSIYQGTQRITFEVLVVDNASQDETCQSIREKFPGVRLHSNKQNLYFTKAANQAIKISQGRYFLLLNPDTCIFPGTLPRMVAFLDSHPQVGALGCRLLNSDGSLQRTGNRFPSLIYLLFEAAGVNSKFPQNWARRHNTYADWDRSTDREVDAVSGACLMVRRTAVDAVGMLDERFPMYFEEVDWCRRIARSGWKIHYDPFVQIIHLSEYCVRNSDRSLISKLYWASLLQYARKHYGVLAFSLLTVLVRARQMASYLCLNKFRLGSQYDAVSSKPRSSSV